MSLDPKCYNLALEELRTPGTYFYYQYKIDSIETVEQCKALIFIAQHDCNIVRNHHGTSYIKNIYQARVELLYQRLFVLQTEQIKLE